MLSLLGTQRTLVFRRVAERAVRKAGPRNNNVIQPQQTFRRTQRRSHSTSPNETDELSFFETVQLLAFRGALAASTVYVITEYCVDVTLCEGPSMHPTIQSSGEIILVDKWTTRRHGMADGSVATERIMAAQSRQRAYQKQQSKTTCSKQHSSFFWHEPRVSVSDLPPYTWSDAWKQMQSPLSVGDVVVVQHPSRKGTVCKRIVALPGDTVIGNTAPRRSTFYSRSNVSVVVPDGCLWLEGDNPANSSDSRDYGPIPANLLVGRVVARVWPPFVWMPRGSPPRTNQPGASTVLPAGYQGQQIRKQLPV
ncbi:mitochondrial inner membrane protease subunit 1 [Fistulifera solaris]|uniref:Mitochondrial inner membrane protease subunit n=1 Tax=Fistulifera solaris TaxID=1519565 RepID=A0A1Z5KNS5_FISSO|nr:mitochondrial inner membrane protease subunit 1 [Fistulifera solaris]|eukprot:GAX27775.1 mitochondrial inner membrane protease subunit 1 [Fistulifera solaris]